ncbi:hypothetical protein SmJEL517_g01840 [Synchytrium microbalum]|uniref:Uncharacterized protein n=1 Tax=Synchytrium microbalum TaxID=1806994 RepID=A0A507CEG7_9FUNG|nr:uncharacterized protein SmJEL517_g01840 [Synchytrium microbalum]TPX35903.1 hypothetical protein SmJEL517_g01840 [Synchytrium microbalum]
MPITSPSRRTTANDADGLLLNSILSSNGSAKLNASTGSSRQHGETDADIKLKTGLQLIQEAYEYRATHLSSELAQWKAAASNQRQQIHALEAEVSAKDRIIADLERKNDELQRSLAQQVSEKKALALAKNTIQDRYQALKRSASQLESFRKSIVSMVEYGPVLTVDGLDRSFTEAGIEENEVLQHQKSYSPAGSQIDADHVSFLQDQTMRSFDLSAEYSDKPPKSATTTPRSNNLNTNSSGNKARSSPTPQLPPPSILKSYTTSKLPPRIPVDWREVGDTPGKQYTPGKRSEKLQKSTPDRVATPETFTKPPSTSTPNNDDDDDNNNNAMPHHTPSSLTKPSTSKHTTTPSKPPHSTLSSPPSGPSYIDAPTLYKHIRDALLPSEFEEFASNVASFNSSQISADEAVKNIGRIVRDRTLFAQMRTLIYTALAESDKSGLTNNE